MFRILYLPTGQYVYGINLNKFQVETYPYKTDAQNDISNHFIDGFWNNNKEWVSGPHSIYCFEIIPEVTDESRII